MDDFRLKAKEARKRLRVGFWDDIIKERRALIEKAEETGQDVHKVEEIYKRKIEAKIQQMEKPKVVDEKEVLYKKVCRIMDSDNITTNPLALLIDHSVFDSLDDNGKQVYILKLSEEYSELKKRYYKEHSADLITA